MPVKPARLAKLTRPRLHSALRRERLFRMLDKRVVRPVVWVSGPPGAGKSTLVASYLEARRLPSWWFQVDEGDLDPATFFYYLNTLARSIAPRKRAALPYLTPEYLGDLPGFARRYFRAFFALFAEQGVLVLDNCQDAASDAFHAVLREACAELPEAVTLVLVSRAELPDELLRAKAEGKVLAIGRDDLRLAPKEAEAIAAAAGRADADARGLNEHVGGWAAGLVLLLAKPGRDAGTAKAGATHEELFGYFAGEILSRAKPQLKAVLLKTSVVPELSVAMAEALSGDPGAGKLLEWLYKRQYFTERRAEGEVAYRYHDLFRVFLRSRLVLEFGNEERRTLYLRAADLLVEKGEYGEAVALLNEAADWHRLGEVVRAEARSLVQAGRWQTLRDWCADLPASVLSGDPWLRFWKAVAVSLSDNLIARQELDQCVAQFAALEDALGQLSVAVVYADIATVAGEGLDALYRWAQLAARILVDKPSELPFDIALRGWRLAVYSFSLHEGSHPMIDRGLAFLMDALLERQLSDYDILVTATAIASQCWIRADIRRFDRVSAIAHPIASAGRGGPVARGRWLVWHSIVLGTLHSPKVDESNGHALVELAREFRIPAFECWGLHLLANSFRVVGEYDLARRYLDALVVHAANGTEQIRFVAATQSILWHVQRREFDVVAQTLEGAIGLTERHGLRPSGAYVRLLQVELLARSGRLDEAQRVLASESALLKAAGVRFLDAVAMAFSAWLALLERDEGKAAALWLEALRESEKPGRRGYLGIYPCVVDLCAFAFRLGLAPENTLALVRQLGFVSPDPHDPYWPRPVEILTFGSFHVRSSGRPIEFGRKRPRRLLSFLYLLVCRGSSGVSRQQATDALWEGADADAAEESLKVATRRLRVLLADADAVEVHQGRIRLSPKHVWADAWEFEALLASAKADGDPKARESALKLYEGELLEGEAEFPEAIAARERLRGLFVQHAEAHGRWLEAQDRDEEALALYARGTRAEVLSEALYCGQMRCLQRLGRTDEACAVFRRLRQTLSVALGAGPSKAALELYERLSAE